MTIEFWPRRLLKPKPKPPPRPRLPRPRRSRLPIRVGKAHQMLSAAILLADHEMASWVDLAAKRHQVTGTPGQLLELMRRLDAVMEPLPAVATPAVSPTCPGSHTTAGAVVVS